MKQNDESEHKPHGELHGKQLFVFSVAALGVVFGDIGTSPLYAVRECFHGPHAIGLTNANVLGVLSLMFWSLILIISIKYLWFILKADNAGEGGILALAALVTPLKASDVKARWVVLTLGLFGASLLYADGMITPAISVLSAVEGLNVATPVFGPYVEPIALVILGGLFYLQSRGTTKIGVLFGPIIMIWFVTLGTLGVVHIQHNPEVLWTLDPLQGMWLFWNNGWHGFLVMGTVFLVVTGGEALYADIGHFGVKPIRITWFAVVLPGLVLNYLGQGAYLIGTPTAQAAENPFYNMAPSWALYPLVALATLAAVIASQAVITGAFSLTLQAIQLGYSPRMRIEHTSPDQKGQIYIPSVNWLLMIMCMALVLGFETSSSLAAAYGLAVTITMVITTMLFYVLLTNVWHWPQKPALALTGFFLLVDLAFFGANVIKIHDGGWFPLLVAIVSYTLLSTWRAGRKLLFERMKERTQSTELYLAELLSNPPTRVAGTAVFMTGNPLATPPALRHNVQHNKVLHEKVVILAVLTSERPHVPWFDRVKVENLSRGFFRIQISYGFMDEPNVPRELRRITEPGLSFTDQDDVSYFLGREALRATDRKGLALWREHLFIWMARNAQPATSYFYLPTERVFEVGVQVDL